MNTSVRNALIVLALLGVAGGGAVAALKMKDGSLSASDLGIAASDDSSNGLEARFDIARATFDPDSHLADLRFAVQEEATPAATPATLANFRISDLTGKSHELYRMNIATALVLISHGTGCPIQQKSYPEVAELEKKYGPLGVSFMYLNGYTADDKASIEKEINEFGAKTPVLLDEGQLVTNDLGFTRTAEVIVVMPKTWEVIYRGAIDDRLGYGAEKPKPTATWLRDALDAVIMDQPVKTAATEPKGCLLDKAPQPVDVVYSKHVAPIVMNRCATCHRDGDIGPFAFDSHRSLATRKDMVREVLMTKRMPPWHADADPEAFANDTAITDKEKQTLIAWIDNGAKGDGADPLHDVEPAAAAQWPFGEPDVVVSMQQNVRLPAQGTIDYQYVNIPYEGEKDLWVRAAVVQPGNMQVVHHVLVFVQYPPEMADRQPEYEGGLEGYFAGYVPGTAPAPFPAGSAKFVPKGSTFILQMHYTATGKPETDLTKLGLYTTEDQPEHELITTAAYNTDFSIPPGTADQPVAATYHVDNDAVLYSVSPHMHYRGKSFEMEAQYPDGRKETLLSVPFYDFNWQTFYQFKEPVALPAGSQLICKGAFDNSAANPMNPDPARTVYFGEQSYEEMFIGYINLIETQKG